MKKFNNRESKENCYFDQSFHLKRHWYLKDL